MYLIHTNALQEALIKLSHYCPDNKQFTKCTITCVSNNAEVAKYYSQSLSDLNFYLFFIAIIIFYSISLKK